MEGRLEGRAEGGGWRVESRVQSGKWTMEGKEWREKSREQRVLQLLGIRGPCTHVSAWPRLRSMRSCRPHASTRQFVWDAWSVSISKPYYDTCVSHVHKLNALPVHLLRQVSILVKMGA